MTQCRHVMGFYWEKNPEEKVWELNADDLPWRLESEIERLGPNNYTMWITNRCNPALQCECSYHHRSLKAAMESFALRILEERLAGRLQ